MPVEIQTTGEDEELMYSARQAQKNDFWSGYALYRPTYKESFFRRICEYHAEKSGTSWSTAHDVGAGHGIVSSTLADKFNHVIVSEPDKEHSEFSRQLLVEKSGRPESKFTFLQERIEESSVETGTVDLITACECMHFTNTVKAVDEFARQLKPGGTLVMTLYTPPLILGNDRAQSIWKAIFDRFFEKSNAGPVFECACRICTAAYNSIAIPPVHWEAVKRVYINASQGVMRKTPE
ncbi:hypothetical protein NUW58_g1791 [Xylaria curta]|uniref:Uncharacterized protein n=1 Tax=Xylaria curta TaxID=42375 RepID=A0ACC1PIQ3_9PEZI|nr:hypothetical protein NUW58_g1791 [Xylaria curta]